MTPKNALECSLIKGLLGTLKERWTLGMQGGRKRDGVRKNGDGTGRKRDGHGTVTVTGQIRFLRYRDFL
jgi:hypothetical protein